MRDENERVLAVHRDPDLIELPRLIGLAGIGRSLRRCDQFVQAERASSDLLQRCEKVVVGHGRPETRRGFPRGREALVICIAEALMPNLRGGPQGDDR